MTLSWDNALLDRSPIRVLHGSGALRQLGRCARDEGARRTLLITDPGVAAAGHADRAASLLREAGVDVVLFAGASENPTTEHVAQGLAYADGVDFIIGLGGGSAMDCAKGVNLLLTNGGAIADYWGVDKPTRPMRPSILIPTTAGTGSEAQSFALISDPVTHQKMACGDRRPPEAGGLRPRVAILDPELTRTQPASVAAITALDALSHAVESAGTRVRNDDSLAFSREAWRLLSAHSSRAMRDPDDNDARMAMLLGAHFAGAAIERSMLGAAHAGANPLTARFGVTHGVAVGVLLPHVIRFNVAPGTNARDNPYAALNTDPEALASTIESLLEVAGVQSRLREHGVAESALPELAELAAKQWTAGFNPRPVGPAEMLDVYRRAF